MVEFLAIGAHAIRRTELKSASRVLVVGSGPIGLGVAYFARIAGADVTVLDAAPDKIEATRALGFATFSPANSKAASSRPSRIPASTPCSTPPVRSRR